MPHSFSASLRIYGDDPPEVITSRLNIEPTETQRKGDKVKTRRSGTYQDNMWGFSCELESGSLDEQIRWLCDELRPQKDAIAELASHHEVVFWCACFAAGPEATIELQPTTMSEMAGFGAQLSLSVYYCDDE